MHLLEGDNPSANPAYVLCLSHSLRCIVGPLRVRFGISDSADLGHGGHDIMAEWNGKEDLGSLAGRPVRLRFEFRNAKFYSFRFE